MISRAFKMILLGLPLVHPLAAFAQEATLSGTIVDSTSSVLPGVTITVVHQATGNRFVAVTDGCGSFRLPVRIGEDPFANWVALEPWMKANRPAHRCPPTNRRCRDSATSTTCRTASIARRPNRRRRRSTRI